MHFMFKELLKQFREQKKWSQKDLADLLGTTRDTIANWESGRGKPSIEMLIKISTVFNTSTDILLGKEILPYSAFGKEIMLPIIGTVRCGHGMPVFEERKGEEPIFEPDINGGDYFWLYVKGDSMYPEISPGSLALIRIQPEVENGEMALVVVNDEEGMIKQVYKSNGRIELRSINPTYKPRTFEGKEINNVIIIGKVKEIRKKY